MKKKKNILIVSLLTVAIVLLTGWATSTRHLDMRFLKDGIPLSGGSIEIIGVKQGWEKEVFQISQDGWVRLPSSYAGKNGACRIKAGDHDYDFSKLGFSRGRETVDFTSSGFESEHTYRFLFYESCIRSKQLPINKDSE
jgi:hypothetical protein